MLTIQVNDTAVRAWLDNMPIAVRNRLQQTIYTLAEKLRSHIVNDKLRGQVLNRRTGRLGQSIQQKVTSGATAITGTVFSAGDVKYAAIHEYGGQTAAHVIEAVNAKALAFEKAGQLIFAKRVNHPGSKIPERSYMRSSLADMKDEIIAKMTLAVQQGTKP